MPAITTISSDSREEPPRRPLGVGQLGPRVHDCELVAPEAAGHIVGAVPCADHGSHPLKQLVTDSMPVLVVDLLEVVEVQHQKAHGLPQAVVGGDRGGEGVVEGCAVLETGQSVDTGLLLQHVEHLLGAQRHPDASSKLHLVAGLHDVVGAAHVERLCDLADTAVDGEEQNRGVAKLPRSP